MPSRSRPSQVPSLVREGAPGETLSDAHLNDFREWRQEVEERSGFTCEPMPFAQSREWRFEDGILRHRSGGFFSVGGVRARARRRELDGHEQVILLQPEVAINGFLLRTTSRGPEVLFQGRVEPGNVDVMQLSPTVQSTEANIRRMHGGTAPPFVEWFTHADAGPVLFDQLQSEEGSRYLGKYNRNVIVGVPPDAGVASHPNFRWYGLEAIQSFVGASNVLNTDSRSVLSCLPWEKLTGARAPFERGDTGEFGRLLRESYRASADAGAHPLVELLEWLARKRVQAGVRTTVVPIPRLDNWIIEDAVMRERRVERGFSVRQFRVIANGREVRTWDQPLIDSAGPGRLTLICQRRNGMLSFLLKASHEVGFVDGVQLSTSITVAPGEHIRGDDVIEGELAQRIDSAGGATVELRCRQSEEGGRFYQDENDYELVRLDDDVPVPASDDYRWATLSQLRRLTSMSGIVTMELRGASALLLKYC